MAYIAKRVVQTLKEGLTEVYRESKLLLCISIHAGPQSTTGQSPAERLLGCIPKSVRFYSHMHVQQKQLRQKPLMIALCIQ